MRFSWSFPEVPEGVPLRVMTYNIQLWQRRNAPAILNEILAADPDVPIVDATFGDISYDGETCRRLRDN